MASPTLQLQITANVQGQQQVQALAAALAQLRTASTQASSGGSGNPFAGITSGASGASSAVSDLASSVVSQAATMAAGFLSAKVAAEAFFDAFHKGLEYNADTESATIGIQTLVNAFYTAKNAAGDVVSSQQQITMAGDEAQRQIMLLRQASLSTAASFDTLRETFQRALGAGASAGLSIDQVRSLTVLVAQAAAAAGLPLSTLNRDVHDLFNGTAATNTILQRTLGITGAQIAQWREQGTLADNLTAKLSAFAETGELAGQTWSATLSHVGNAFSMVLGQMTEGPFAELKAAIQNALKDVFDPKTLGISDQFAEIEKLGESVFGGLGHLLSDGIYSAVEGAKEFDSWLGQNADSVAQIRLTFGYILDGVISIAKTIAGSIADLAQWGTESGIFQTSLNGVAILVAMIQDGFQLITMYIAKAGAALVDSFGGPLKKALADVAEARLGGGAISNQIAGIAASLSQAIPTSGGGLRATAAEIAKNFADGNTAVAKMQSNLKTGLATQKANAAENARLQAKQKTSPAGSFTAKPSAEKDKNAGKEQKAAEDLAKAKAAAVKAVQDAYRAAEEAANDLSLERQQETYAQYLDRKAALQQDALDKEKAALQAEYDQTKSRQTADSADALKKQANLVRIQGQIDALTQKERAVKIKLELDKDQYVKDMRDLTAQLQADLLDSQGRSAEATQIRLENERKKTLDNPKLTDLAGGADTVNQTFVNKELSNDIAGQATLLQQRNDQYKRYDSLLQQLQDAGQITSLQHETLLAANRAQVIADEEKLVKQMEADAAASDNPDLKAKAEQARLDLEALKNTSDSVATAINTNFSQALVQGLEDFISRAKTIGDVLRDILLSVVSTWEKIAAQNLAESIFGKIGGNQSSFGGLFSASSGGINFGSLLSSAGNFFGGFFKDGGIIDGPGTGTSDSIVARLSKGEGIVKSRAVQYWGEDFIHFLNSAPGYATGGIAGVANSPAISALAAKATPSGGVAIPAPQVAVRLVNSIDPALSRDAMDSVEGERVIENILSRNPQRFRAAMNIR